MADIPGLDPEQTIHLLRRGATTWQRPFPPGRTIRPVSLRTGLAIAGGRNALELIRRATDYGYTDNRWATAGAISTGHA